MELTLLLFIPAIAAFVWPLILFLKKDTVIMAQYMMAIAQVLTGFSLIFYISFFNDIISSHLVADILYMISVSFLMPVYYMFICALTSKEGITRRQRLFFVPSVIFTIGVSMLLVVLGPDRYAFYMNNVMFDGNFVLLPSLAYRMSVIIGFFGFRIFIIAQYIFVMVKGINRMRQYYKTLNSYYTSNERTQKNSYHHINILAWVIMSITLVIILLPYQYVEANLGLTYIGVLVMTATQIFFGQYAYQITYTASQLDSMNQSKSQPSKSDTPCN